MRKPKIIIVGGGTTGLICAYKLKDCCDVTIVEKNNLGGDFCKGETKYIKYTKTVLSLFDGLEVPYSKYVIKNGILLKDVVTKLDESFFKREKQTVIERIIDDYYRKTRLSEPPKEFEISMTEPSFLMPKKALRTDSVIFLETLVENITNVRKVFSTAKEIGCKTLKLSNGENLIFDYLIFTIPLWDIKKIVWWDLGYFNAMRRNVLYIQPKIDRFLSWHYVYTPYTTGNAIYRLSPYNDGYMAEVNGDLKTKVQHIMSDLYSLFPDGWYFLKNAEVLKGHILDENVDFSKWPRNIDAIGMYARWEKKSTVVDTTLNRINQLKRKWSL